MTGRLAKAKLAAIDTATTPATILLFLAGGIMMAMNIPYSPTLKALTTFAGEDISHQYAKVGTDRPSGTAMAMAPNV